jgi:hypothetical protein
MDFGGVQGRFEIIFEMNLRPSSACESKGVMMKLLTLGDLSLRTIRLARGVFGAFASVARRF